MSDNAHMNPLISQHPAIYPSTFNQGNALAPPPELSYKTKEDLHSSVQSWANNHGYALYLTPSSATDREIRTTYQCDRSGVHKAREVKQLGLLKLNGFSP